MFKFILDVDVNPQGTILIFSDFELNRIRKFNLVSGLFILINFKMVLN